METRRLWLADTESLWPLIDDTGMPSILPPDDVLEAQAEMLEAQAEMLAAQAEMLAAQAEMLAA